MTEPLPGQIQGAASMITYRMGGRDYPLRSVATCKVCRSPSRFEIERELVSGRTYATIARAVSDTDPDINPRNIRDHYANGHLPMEQEASRRIIEKRAVMMGRSVEEGVDSIVSGLAVAEVVVQKGFEAIARGELRPDMKDVLMAVKILETFGTGSDGTDESLYVEAYMIFHETASQVMSQEQFADFGRRLNANPSLRRLVAIANKQMEEAGEEDESVSQEPLTATDEAG